MNKDTLYHISTFLSAEDINNLRNTSKLTRNIRINPLHIHITYDNLEQLLPFIRDEKSIHSFTVDDDDVKLPYALIAQGASRDVIASILDKMEISQPVLNYDRSSIVANIFNASAFAGRIDIVELYIERNIIDVFSENFYPDGRWNLNTIRFLHDIGVNIFQDDFISQAVGFDRFDTVQFLVELGAIDSILYVESPQMLLFLATLGVPIDTEEIANRIVERYEMEIPWSIDFVSVILELFPDFPMQYYIEYFDRDI